MKEKLKRYLMQEADIIPELELWYKLDNFVSTAYVHDYSGNGITGAVREDAKPSYPGFVFNGLDEFIDTNNKFQSVFQDSFSISIWARGTAGTVFGGDAGDGAFEDGISIKLSTNTLSAVFKANGDEVTATENADSFPNANVYRHIIATFEADTQIRLYVNAVEQTLSVGGDGDASGVTFADYGKTVVPPELYIGAINADGNDDGHFAGNIADFRIYSKLLSAVEVKNIYELTRWRYSV